jgi:Domain of unknown function (DUF1735)
MNYINLAKRALFLAFVAIGFSACEKVKEIEPIGDKGQTIVKLINGDETTNPGHTILGIDFVNRTQTVDIADIRRDVPNNAELNRPMTVVIKDDTAALRRYNTINGTNLLAMPTSWYTLNPAPVGGSGGTYTVTFAPGEFAKQISVTVPNATLLNPSATYGFAFTITSVDADGVIGAARTLVFELGAKNAYDGIYQVVSGNVTRYSAPGVVESPSTLNGSLAGNQDVYLITVGATTLAIPNPGPGGLQWGSGSGSGVAGINDLRLVVDPITNLTTITSGGNPTLTNWAGKVNRYDPATKTFYLAFRWNPAGATREYEVVLKYKAPR